MRVALDVSSALASKTGIGHYVSSLLDALKEQGSVEVYPYALTARASRANEFGSIKRWPIPGRIGPLLWTRVGLPSGERLTGECDVVHGTNFWVPPLKSSSGIVTVHDLTFLYYPEFCTGPVRDYKRTLPRVLETCAAVVTPTKTVKDQLVRELGFPAERVSVTYHGVRKEFFDARPSSTLNARLGLDKPYLLFAGNREPRKNLHRLLMALRELSDGEITLALAGPAGWGEKDLQTDPSAEDLKKRLRFLGYISDRELASVMAGAVSVVFPSIYEGFGLPALEACAAGVPIVAGRVGGLPEVLGDIPYWCDPLDVNSITQAITEAMSADGFDAAKARSHAATFTWERSARQTTDAYLRALRALAQ